MKQFFHINSWYYSLDGIMAIHVDPKTIQDIMSDIMEEVECAICNSKQTGGKVVLNKLKPGEFEGFLIVIHHDHDENPVCVDIPPRYVKTQEDADAFEQYFVEKISTSNDSIVEVNEIIEDFHQHKTELIGDDQR